MEINRMQTLMSASRVKAHLPAVVDAADADRLALGFFAESVYAEFSRKEQLLVLVDVQGGEKIYAGHLLFDVKFPKAHVLQIHVAKRFRGHQLGSALLDALKAHLTDLGFISIFARVAEDLTQANGFWNSQGFYTQRLTQGGKSRNRTIVVRAHELKTAQHFCGSGISAADPLGLDFGEQRTRPLYLLDLNVLFDLGPRRERHLSALDVFRAERMQTCALAISSEIEVELTRTARDTKTDPMLAFAGMLSRFPVPDADVLARLLPGLGEIVFPARSRAGTLSANDLSDLKHLATAIHNGLPGLITNDETVLAAAPSLRKEYGLDVLSPVRFQAPLDEHEQPVVHAASNDDTITIERAQHDDAQAIQALLTFLGIGVVEQLSQWAAAEDKSTACVRLVARCEGAVIGYMALPASPQRSNVRAYVAVREDLAGAEAAAHAFLLRLHESVPIGGVGNIHLSCPDQQATLREAAASFGYTASPSAPTELMKVSLKQHVRASTWGTARQALFSAVAMQLPENPPEYRHVDQQLPLLRRDGQRMHVSIFQLEALLAPALLCLQGRNGVMVPIQRRFEEPLIAQSPQTSWLPVNKAQLRPQRLYVSGPKTLKNFHRGDLMFFYESSKDKGTRSVIAVGRVLRAFHRGQGEVETADLSGSILTEDQLSEIGAATTKTVTVFDNVLRLPCPVSLEHLKSLGCGSSQQLLTAQRLSAQQVQGILEKGFQ